MGACRASRSHLGRREEAQMLGPIEIRPRSTVRGAERGAWRRRGSFKERLAASKAARTAGAPAVMGKAGGVWFGDVLLALVGSDSQTRAFDKRRLDHGRVEESRRSERRSGVVAAPIRNCGAAIGPAALRGALRRRRWTTPVLALRGAHGRLATGSTRGSIPALPLSSVFCFLGCQCRCRCGEDPDQLLR